MSEREEASSISQLFTRIRKEDVPLIAESVQSFLRDHEPILITQARERAAIKKRNRRLFKVVLPEVAIQIQAIANDLNVVIVRNELDTIKHPRDVSKVVFSTEKDGARILLAVLIKAINAAIPVEEALTEDIAQLAIHFIVSLSEDAPPGVSLHAIK